VADEAGRSTCGTAPRTVSRMRRAILVPWLLVAVGVAAAGPHDATTHQSFADVDYWHRVFDDPARDAWQKPDALVAALAIPPATTVADLVRPFTRARDDQRVFTELAVAILESVESDPSFLRLLLYSALEGHEMARPFYETRMRRLREFLSRYIGERTRDGAFRDVDPELAARAFMGMVADHLIARTVFGQRDAQAHGTQRIAETFTSIFLDGMRAGPSREWRP